jgi:predicted esterase
MKLSWLLATALVLLPGCFKTAEKRSTGRQPAAGSEDESAAPSEKKKRIESEDPDDNEAVDGDREEQEPEKEDPPPAEDEHTNGSGGQKSGELRSGSGLRFIISVPEDNQANVKAHGLLVLLHGSGASNYNNFVRMMSGIQQEQGLILVSVLAPNGRGWNEGGEQRAADQLHELIQRDIFPKYNVDKKRVLFSGQSSGGGFLGSNFVAQHAKDYKGGAFLQCGAEAPRVVFTPDDATKRNFRLHLEITNRDPIWPRQYAQALKAYGDAGLQISHDESKPGGHCAFDQQQVIRDHIDFVLGKQG